MLESAGEGTHCRTGAIRDDCDDVGNEYTRDLTPISLDLVPGVAESGVLISRVLQLQQADGQAVEENENVGAAVVAGFDNGELVERPPIVVPRGIEVHELQAHSGRPAVIVSGLNRYSAHHQLVEPLVLTHHVLRLRALNPRYGRTNKIRISIGIETGKRISHVAPQDAVTKGIPHVIHRSINRCVPGAKTNLG